MKKSRIPRLLLLKILRQVQKNLSSSDIADSPKSFIIEDIVNKMHANDGVKIKTRRWRLKSFKCFYGSELIEWLMNRLSINKEEAITLAKSLVNCNVIEHVGGYQPFQDNSLAALFKFKDDLMRRSNKRVLSRAVVLGEQPSKINDEIPRKEFIDDITSEQYEYVKNLECLMKLNVILLQKQKLLDSYFAKKNQENKNEELRKEDIIGNLDEILRMHKSFVDNLEARTQNTTNDVAIGDIIAATTFKEYRRYFGGFEKAIITLSHCFASDVFTKEEKEKGSQGNRLLDLASYLMMPFQHVAHYFHLLQGLCEHTPKQAPDHAQIKTAINNIEQIVSYSLSYEKQAVNLNEILSIQTLIQEKCPALVIPQRTFVREGRLLLKSQERIKPKNYYVFMFNDLLVYTRKKQKK